MPKIDESALARPPATTTTAPTTQAVAPQNSTTSTTITRRDQEGNVVDVQKSQSGTAPVQPDARQPDVRDPFK